MKFFILFLAICNVSSFVQTMENTKVTERLLNSFVNELAEHTQQIERCRFEIHFALKALPPDIFPTIAEEFCMLKNTPCYEPPIYDDRAEASEDEVMVSWISHEALRLEALRSHALQYKALALKAGALIQTPEHVH